MRREDRLMEVIERFDGRPFPKMAGLGPTVGDRPAAAPLVVAGDDLLRRARATTYQHMGLLPGRRPASWYDPGRFWSGDRIELVAPFALGGEIAVH